MTRVIYRERIPSTDPRLKRHVHHDSESRRYPFDTAGLTLKSVKHTRRIPVLDQGQLGSCTGNAGIGCLGTDPYYDTVALPHVITTTGKLTAADAEEIKRRFLDKVPDARARGMVVLPEGARYTARVPYTFDESGAVQLYSDATKADDYPGQYPPTDTGSDGLTIAKVLTAAGEISGYQHTFTLDDALLALTATPFITGVTWYQDMFQPDPDGRVHPTGAVAGGHEFVADEIDATNERVWFTNSWSTDWGLAGRFYLSFGDYGKLLAQQGDVTIFTPLSAPPPTPTPVPPGPADTADQALAAAARPWVARHHTSIAGNHKMQAALKAWLVAKGLAS